MLRLYGKFCRGHWYRDLVSIDGIPPVSHYPHRPIAAEPRGGTELFLFHSRSSSHTPLLLEFRYVESDFVSIDAQLKLVLRSDLLTSS
jgi:hypothetical protein